MSDPRHRVATGLPAPPPGHAVDETVGDSAQFGGSIGWPGWATQLRELAALSASQTREARELMPEALCSIGYPLPTEAEFAARCQAALDVVQRDLDATGHSGYQMHPRRLLISDFALEMYAALPDGGSWSCGGVGGMKPDMDDETLLWHAAASVSDPSLKFFGSCGRNVG